MKDMDAVFLGVCQKLLYLKWFGRRLIQVTIHSTPLTTLIKKVSEVQEAICLLEVTTGILENEYLMFYFLSVKK